MSLQIFDELETGKEPEEANEVKLALIFPHWRAGTLPIAGPLTYLFPTALESPRVMFTFVDAATGEKFPGWVVRSSKYVLGLREWYKSQGLIPGNYVHINRSKNPGEIIIRIDKHRPSREWIRTALIGSDGGLVFSMLRQMVTAPFDERMVVAIQDLTALDRLWEPGVRSKRSLEQMVINTMYELAKLNPQGHVHLEELYAAVNLTYRCSPNSILGLLINRTWANHLGDLYFRLEKSIQKDKLL
jgi:hypothetical protein